jgi:hypothetical protein
VSYERQGTAFDLGAAGYELQGRAREDAALAAPRFVPDAAEWAGERCFIVCGGPSVRAQRGLIPHLQGRIIVIKQAVILRPDADIMFVSGRDDAEVCKAFFPQFKGGRIVCRKAYPGFPPEVLFAKRTHVADRLCKDAGWLAGLDAGTSAINLAYQLGAAEIVLLGYDMGGARWFRQDEIKHHLPVPPAAHHKRHMAAARGVARDLEAAGVKVWNASPDSAATFFEHRPLESFL